MTTAPRFPDSVPDGRLRPVPDRPGWSAALLPSPTVQAHAANLLPLPNGDLGCVWFGGTQEGMADISIHFSRLAKGSDHWSPAVRLIDDPGRSEQNPILFLAPDGRLWLIYTSQKGGNQDSAIVRCRTSLDNGATWSTPATLIDDPGTFVRQPIYIREDGAWLLPTFACRTHPGERWTGSDDTSAVRISLDQGSSWSEHRVPGSRGAVHMNILDAGNGRLVALFRSRFADYIYRSVSSDGGRTWEAPTPTALPNNNSSIQATVLRDGRLALAYNASSAIDATERRAGLYDDIEGDGAKTAAATRVVPISDAERAAFWGAPRAPLALALSSDHGLTWAVPVTLDTSDGYCITNNSRDKLNRELSYPSVKQTADGRIHVAYTYFRQAIKYVVLAAPPG